MLTMEIRPLDASDPEAMAAWHEAHHEAQVYGEEHPSPWLLEEMRAEFLGERPGQRVEPFGGYVDGRVVTTGVVELPLMDNLKTARVEVHTRPGDRRHGHGTAMLEHLTAVAESHGRDTVDAEATWPYEAPADGAGTPGAEFLTRHGFRCTLGDVKRLLSLPADDGLLDRLAREAAPYHRDYVLRDWSGPVPEDVIEPFGGLIGSLMTEAPTGDREIEPEVFDAARIRADEQVMAASGRTKHTTVALSADGEPVAYTEIAVPSFDPVHAYQWGTLVRRAHRGRRLGLAVKVHNLRRFQAIEPGRSTLFTWNAEVNSHMIAVNEAIGFRPAGRLGEFQRKL